MVLFGQDDAGFENGDGAPLEVIRLGAFCSEGNAGATEDPTSLTTFLSGRVLPSSCGAAKLEGPFETTSPVALLGLIAAGGVNASGLFSGAVKLGG